MKNLIQSGELLHDVLADDVVPTAAGASLDAVLGAVRRRRRWKRIRSASGAGALVLAVLFAAVWWRRPVPDRVPVGVAEPAPAAVVRVGTVILAPAQLVATVPGSAAVARVVTSGGVTQVESDQRSCEWIDDGGLLHLLAGQGAVLIDGPGGSRGLYLAGPGASGRAGERVP